MNSELESLKRQLNDFYDKNFISDEEEYYQNKKIKLEIIHFILDKHKSQNFNLVKDAIRLLFENTGCQEDVEILKEIIPPLLVEKIISTKEIKEYFQISSISRWI